MNEDVNTQIFFSDLDLPQYIGICEGASSLSGFKLKEFRVDYSGTCDIGIQRIELFPLLSDLQKRPPRIMVSEIPKEHKREDYTCFVLDQLTNDINEKATRLIVTMPHLLKQTEEFVAQIGKQLNASEKKIPAVDLNENTQYLLGQIEWFFYLLHATLDLYAKLAAVFNRKAPQKFGQQLWHKNHWDKPYQDFLARQDELRFWLNQYRNRFAHEFSLKIRFKKVEGKWLAIVSADYHATEGLVIPDVVSVLWNKFLEFSRFFDRYFFAKFADLDPLVAKNFA